MNRNAASMHNTYLLFWLAAVFVVLPSLPSVQEEADPWLILTNGEKGSINARTTRQDLVRLYGAEDVTDRDVNVGEGATETATVLFPNDPKRTVEILWQDHDKKSNPSRVTISGKTSHWHAVHGISLGTSYSELERLNGRPFQVSWGTDQGSVLLSWKGGLLERDLKGEGHVFIWLDDAPSSNAGLSGTSQKSDAPSKAAKGKQERRVNQIAWEFPYQVPR